MTSHIIRSVAAAAALLLGVAVSQAQNAPNNGSIMTPNSAGGGGAPSGTAGGVLSGTYPNPGYAVQPLVPSNNLSDLASAATARTNLGLGAISTLNAGTGLSSGGGNLNISNQITAGGPIGSATLVPVITYNAQGQLTTVTTATIAPPFSAITGTPTTVAGYGITNALLTTNNLSDVANAATSRTNLGLGSIATQAASAVAITGGTIDGTAIGGTTASTGKFSTVTIGAGSAITSSGAGGTLGSNAFTSTAYAPLASPTFTGTVTMPDASTFTSSAVNLATNTTVTSASFGLTGNISGAGIIGVNGIRYKNAAATMTDTTLAGSGVTTGYTDVWGGNTITSTSVATVANYYGSYFKVPSCTGNLTCTNLWALGVDSLGVANGTKTVPSLAFQNSPGNGVYWRSGIAFGIAGGGKEIVQVASGGNLSIAGNQIGMSSTDADVSISGSNVLLAASGVASLQFGGFNVNGAPVAQTLSFQGALAGSATNQASANTTIIGSLGTGTGTNGDFIFQCGVKTTTGTAQATPTTCLTIKGETLATILAGSLTASGIVAATAAGSAGAPSLTVGNATTGLYSVGTTGLALSVNGVNKADFGISNGAAWTVQGGLLVFGALSMDGFNISAGGANNSLPLVTSNTATAVNTGNITLTTGNNTQASGTNSAGNITLTGGNASGAGSTGNGGNIVITAGTTVGGTAGTIQMVNLGPAATGTAYLCWNSSGNIVSENTTCTVSALAFKNLHDAVTPAAASARMDVALRPGAPAWDYKTDETGRVHIGLIADDVEKMDPRCAVYEDGKLKSYEDRCVIAYLVADRQNMKAEIESLKARLR